MSSQTNHIFIYSSLAYDPESILSNVDCPKKAMINMQVLVYHAIKLNQPFIVVCYLFQITKSKRIVY